MLERIGLTPKRYSSGQTDYDGRISRCGDEMVRTALYQAANVLLHHGKWSSLRSWAMRIAKRGSVKGAKVALAHRLAVVMHRMWTDGTDFRWSDAAGNAASAAIA
jgi:transposase